MREDTLRRSPSPYGGKFGARNFKIVLLQPIARFEPDWGSEIVANRYLDRFAPWADATDGHVRSWDAVFSEFPHRSGACAVRFRMIGGQPLSGSDRRSMAWTSSDPMRCSLSPGHARAFHHPGRRPRPRFDWWI